MIICIEIIPRHKIHWDSISCHLPWGAPAVPTDWCDGGKCEHPLVDFDVWAKLMNMLGIEYEYEDLEGLNGLLKKMFGEQ